MDVDRFVISNPQELPNEQQFEQFKDRFLTRLQSSKSLLNKHSWRFFLTNILLGFATIGIALGIQLAVSKFRNNRATLSIAMNPLLHPYEKN